MGKKLISTAAVLLSAALSSSVNTAADTTADTSVPDGFLAWHSYSSYDARDSRLFVRSPEGTVTEIKGNFVNQMNADFGASPDIITFMAIDPTADEWDIYIYSLSTDKYINLTENSGCRNEDPKFSPDGTEIVFKRGKWSHEADGFVYNIYTINLQNGEINQITDTPEEESMPYYSSDGNTIYYASLNNGESSVRSVNLMTGISEDVFSENGRYAYYPVCRNNRLYFTAWCSSENRNDHIYAKEGNCISPAMPQNDDLNYSDACPVSDNSIIYSSTESGSYDLYFYNGTDKYPLSAINTENNELGAAFYSTEKFRTAINDLEQYLHGNEGSANDLTMDDVINIKDLILLKKLFY